MLSKSRRHTDNRFLVVFFKFIFVLNNFGGFLVKELFSYSANSAPQTSSAIYHQTSNARALPE